MTYQGNGLAYQPDPWDGINFSDLDLRKEIKPSKKIALFNHLVPFFKLCFKVDPAKRASAAELRTWVRNNWREEWGN
jgi:hypothetical protein